MSQWDLYAYDYFMQKYTNGTGKEWKTNASGIVCSYYTDYRPGTNFIKWEWMLPYCKMPLKFLNSYKTNGNSCGLRFLFYRGLQEGKVQTYQVDEYVVIIEENKEDCKDYLHNLMFQMVDISGGVQYPTLLLSNAEVDFIVAAISANGTTAIELMDMIQYYIDTYGFARDPVGNSLTALMIVNHIVSNYCDIVSVNSGVLTSLATKKYPMGTNDVYDAFGTKIPEANLSTKWDGEYGIYEKLAKPFIKWYNEMTKAVTVVFMPNAEDLFMDFSQKQRINGIDYLVDEIRVEIKDDEIGVAEMDAWSC
jgi:hypothetical protein